MDHPRASQARERGEELLEVHYVVNSHQSANTDITLSTLILLCQHCRDVQHSSEVEWLTQEGFTT
jgi:hypothetical protein